MFVELHRELTPFVEDWVATGKARSTAEGYAAVLRRFDAWPSLSEARAHVGALVPRACAQHHARALRAFSRWWAEETGEEDTMARLKIPKVLEAPNPSTATADDVKRLLAACRTPRDRAVIAVLWSTGCRRGELAGMAYEHLAGDAVLLPKTKNGRPRVAPLSTEAQKALRRWLRVRGTAPGPLWTGSRGPLTPAGVRMVVRHAAERAGVELSTHSLRRGFAVSWLTDGGSETSLKTLAGWSSGAMVTRYTRAVSQELALEEARRLRP